MVLIATILAFPAPHLNKFLCITAPSLVAYVQLCLSACPKLAFGSVLGTEIAFEANSNKAPNFPELFGCVCSFSGIYKTGKSESMWILCGASRGTKWAVGDL